MGRSPPAGISALRGRDPESFHPVRAQQGGDCLHIGKPALTRTWPSCSHLTLDFQPPACEKCLPVA